MKGTWPSERASQSGASVIAILRGGRAFPNPQPSDRMEAGDTLMVIGDREQVDAFRGRYRSSPAI